MTDRAQAAMDDNVPVVSATLLLAAIGITAGRIAASSPLDTPTAAVAAGMGSAVLGGGAVWVLARMQEVGDADS